MLRNLAKSQRLRTHCFYNKLVSSHETLHLKHRLLFPGQTQQAYLSILSRASNAIYSLRKYPKNFRNTSQRPASTNTEKATTKTGRKIVIASSLFIGATVFFVILDYKRTEAEAKEHEIKEFTNTFERGGPKNLAIVTRLTDEKDFEANKPRLVILGSGWGVVYSNLCPS